ncbi:MAG: hypothetical protein JST64_04605 [Actinobacteria bacterium]|nr:hypothetical protein [Actinomycetota bacterium]
MPSSPVPTDTDPDVFRRQIAAWRAMTPIERFELADRLSAEVIALAVAGIRFEQPEATPAEIRFELARRRFGRALAEAARDTPPAS